MDSFWNSSFIVVDVETNGSDALKNRITEIACVLIQGGEIVSKFSSLVNPHQFIPPYIVKMTGITNEMAFQAPEPDPVFKKAVEMFNAVNPVFVAHNARFDWSFIQQSLIRANLTPLEMPVLCTLKLAKRLLPKDIKKNVGALANYFNIPMLNRHRALADAEATAKFLIDMLEKAEQEHNIVTAEDLLVLQNKTIKHFKIKNNTIQKFRNLLDAIPKTPGVYYFKDKRGKILYIGKAKSLQSRVRSYFHSSNLKSNKTAELVSRINDISWKCTESELNALLLESKEIKSLQPPFNSLEKRMRRYPFIKMATNDDYPFLEITYDVDESQGEFFGPFRSSFLAEEVMNSVETKFRIRKCEKHIVADSEKQPCMYYHIDKCCGPCSDFSSLQSYANQIEQVRQYLKGFSNGIIEQFEKRMEDKADKLDFEAAAEIRNQVGELRRLFDRQQNVSTALSSNNAIMLLPGSEREKTIEIYCIKHGLLESYRQIGRRARLDDLFKEIEKIYFLTNGNNKKLSLEQIDEIKIIGSWIYRHKDNATVIYFENKSLNTLKSELENSIRNFVYHKELEISY